LIGALDSVGCDSSSGYAFQHRRYCLPQISNKFMVINGRIRQAFDTNMKRSTVTPWRVYKFQLIESEQPGYAD